ncbi:MAG: DNA translocase FtsK 4TM domain-containing protein [Nitrospirota bacterium]
MKEKKKKKNNKGPLDEALGIALIALSIIITISLLSYSSIDPSFNTAGGDRKVSNYIGVFGSYLADILLQLFGGGTYLIPLLIFFYGGNKLLRKEKEPKALRLAGGISLLLTASSLLRLRFDALFIFNERIPSGGLIGSLISDILIRYLSTTGSYIVIVTILLFSLTITTRFSLVSLASGFKDASVVVFNRISDYMRERRERKFRAKSRVERKTREVIETEEEVETPVEAPKIVEAGEKEVPKPALVQTHFRFMEPGGEFQLPSLSLLDDPPPGKRRASKEELLMSSNILEKKLQDFGVEGRVTQVQPGPVVTMYEFEPAPGIKLSKIVSLADDLAMAMRSVSVRVAPIPGKSVVGIEIPNHEREDVFLKEILSSEDFRKSPSKLTVALGKDIFGNPVITDLARMPHLLVAGATGSGKSMAINAMVCSILFNASPGIIKMLMIDPKRLELSAYEDIPCLLHPVITNAKIASEALLKAVWEMERRYRLLAESGVRNIDGYNNLPGVEPIPYLLIVIDELADLMLISSNEVEDSIARLAQMARAAGIHLVIATQRPSVDVLTGVIKANFPARISFQVSSKTDSRTILDANGAEQLLGKGDMLFLPPGTARLTRIHGAYISEKEIKRVVGFINKQARPDYESFMQKEIETKEDTEGEVVERDELYSRAVEIVTTTGQASISMIQRRLRVGYNRAARMIEMMEEDGIVSPPDHTKGREVIYRRRFE